MDLDGPVGAQNFLLLVIYQIQISRIILIHKSIIASESSDSSTPI